MLSTSLLVLLTLGLTQTLASPAPLPVDNEAKPLTKPDCGADMKAYCVGPKNTWAEYDPSNPLCLSSIPNRALCSSHPDITTLLSLSLPTHGIQARWCNGGSSCGHQQDYGNHPVYPDRNGRYPDAKGRYPTLQGQYPDKNGRYPDKNGFYPTLKGQYPDKNGLYPDAKGNYPDKHGNYPTYSNYGHH